jgi:anaerobic selenocysteine-containing dehydrogenase
MIEAGWFDRDFVREFSNGPFLVRADTGRFLTEGDLRGEGPAGPWLAWDVQAEKPVALDRVTGRYQASVQNLALFGRYRIPTATGEIDCSTAFQLYTELCRRYPPDQAEQITWVPAAQIREAALLLWEARPVSYYAWTGIGQSTNATQTDRALSLLYALTGSVDVRGGNVSFDKVPTPDVTGAELIRADQRAKALGLAARPLGPPRSGWITSDDIYRAILEGNPYRVRGLVGFGANLLVSHADVLRGRAALAALDFFVHLDLFMTPTAALADIVLPVSSAWEHANLKIGFEVSAKAESLVQLRSRVVAPRGEARSDAAIVFALAKRLGLGAHFWEGDLEAAWAYQLGPSGLTLDELRHSPRGLEVPLEIRHRPDATDTDGDKSGFPTPSGKIEIYSEVLLEHGYQPLPEYVEPLVGPVARPDLAVRYPLVLTCAKIPEFCHSQHRGLPGLRRLVRDPQVEIHPSAAAARDVANGDWVVIETPDGRVRARARFNESLDPRVVSGQHGWWQSCGPLNAPSYDPFSAEGANYNLLIGNTAFDPISGSVPHRAYLCEVFRDAGVRQAEHHPS